MKKTVTAAAAAIVLVGGVGAVGTTVSSVAAATRSDSTIAEPRFSSTSGIWATVPVLSRSPGPGEPDVPRVDDPNESFWDLSRTPSWELRALDLIVGETAERHSHVFAGAAYVRDYTALVVYASDLEAPEVAELKATIGGKPAAEQILFQKVDYSMDELLAAATAIDLASIPGAKSAGPDVTTNEVSLGRDDSMGDGPTVGSVVRLSALPQQAGQHGIRGGMLGHPVDRDLFDVRVHVVREIGEITALPAPA